MKTGICQQCGTPFATTDEDKSQSCDVHEVCTHTERVVSGGYVACAECGMYLPD